METHIALQGNTLESGLLKVGQLTPYTCPPVTAPCSNSKPGGSCAFAVIRGMPIPPRVSWRSCGRLLMMPLEHAARSGRKRTAHNAYG